MSIEPPAAIAFALMGNLVLSLGMALQKKHVAWIGLGPLRKKDAGGWLLGFALMNAVPAFQYLALLGLSAHVVAAAAGTSVAFTAILARILLGERLGRRRIAWTLFLFAAIAAAGFLGEGGSSRVEGFLPPFLYLFLALPAVAGLALFRARRRHRGPRLAVLLAAASGCLGGSMVLPMRALQLTAGEGLVSWLASPYFYAWLALGSWSFVLAQAAYKDGEMASISPALYGMQVLWPAFASYFVFGARFYPAQVLAFLLVAACIATMERRRGPRPGAPSAPYTGPERRSRG